MSRFGDDHGVKLVLYKRGVEIARVPVLPSACGVDPANAEQVELPILIEIAIDKIMITILDGNAVMGQNAGVGGWCGGGDMGRGFCEEICGGGTELLSSRNEGWLCERGRYSAPVVEW